MVIKRKRMDSLYQGPDRPMRGSPKTPETPRPGVRAKLAEDIRLKPALKEPIDVLLAEARRVYKNATLTKDPSEQRKVIEKELNEGGLGQARLKLNAAANKILWSTVSKDKVRELVWEMKA